MRNYYVTIIEKQDSQEFFSALNTICMCYPFVTKITKKYVYCYSVNGEGKDIGEEMANLIECKWRAPRTTPNNLIKYYCL